MKPNVAVLVAMSRRGMAACRPIKGVCHALSGNKFPGRSALRTHLEETSNADCGNEKVHDPLSTVQAPKSAVRGAQGAYPAS